MALYTNIYDLSDPANGDAALNLGDDIRVHKGAINERISVEHSNFVTGSNDDGNDDAQGRHLPGKTSVLYEGTTGEINALSGMVTGAVAWDTTTRELKHYITGTGWVARLSNKFYNMYDNSGVAVTTGFTTMGTLTQAVTLAEARTVECLFTGTFQYTGALVGAATEFVVQITQDAVAGGLQRNRHFARSLFQYKTPFNIHFTGVDVAAGTYTYAVEALYAGTVNSPIMLEGFFNVKIS